MGGDLTNIYGRVPPPRETRQKGTHFHFQEASAMKIAVGILNIALGAVLVAAGILTLVLPARRRKPEQWD